MIEQAAFRNGGSLFFKNIAFVFRIFCRFRLIVVNSYSIMTENKKSGNGIGIGAALGVAFGAAYGASSGKTALSIAMGLAIGVAVGAIFDLVKTKGII
ncbi:hypothetical protein [Haliscomenobacter sp.]|uniref:hypothetical protein n=1 Tax=Haliscomenobacter sp. TaxID=2717303 RepID=UPI00359453FD